MTEIRRQFRLSLLLFLLVGGLLVQWLVQPFLGLQGRRNFIRLWSRALLAACGVKVVLRYPTMSFPHAPAEPGGIDAATVPASVLPVHTPSQTTATLDVPLAEAAVSGRASCLNSRQSSCSMPGVGADAAVDSAESVSRSLADLAPGRMLVANHPSWLDIFAINAVAPAAFVAKAEIGRWPLVGTLVSGAGTIYIERGRRRAVPEAILAMRERLKEGWPVALFPEATTHWGPALGPFHGNLLEAAIAGHAGVVPIGVRYVHEDGSPGEAAHFLGEQTFMQSVWAILGARGLRVELLVLPPVPAAGKTRAALAAELRGLIGAVLGKIDAAEEGKVRGRSETVPAEARDNA